MAFDPKKQKNSQRPDESANPYESVIGGTAQALPPPGIAAPEQPYGGQLGGADSGPSATGYVNFDRIYGANEGTAAREAKSRGDAAKGAAQKAQAGLTGMQGKFNAGVTGATNAGPNAADYTYATGQAQFAQPKAEQLAGRDRSAMTAGGAPTAGFAVKDPTEAEWRGNLEAGAKKGYGGPDALSGMDEYLKLAQDTEAAQQAINNPTTGLNQLDAALLGAAGRPRYAELQQQYGGLKGDLEKANAASAEQGKAAAATSKTGREAYERLLSDYDAKNAPGQAGTPGTAGGAGGWHPPGYDSLDSFLGGGDGMQDLHSAGQALSPADWATRGLGELGYGGPMASEGFGNAVTGGAANGQNMGWNESNVRTALNTVMGDYGKDAADYLWQHMTEEQWNTYLSAGNPGNMARMMRAYLESAGYSKTAKDHSNPETHTASDTNSDDQRNELAKGHWVVDPATGKRYDSLEEWDKDHPPKG